MIMKLGKNIQKARADKGYTQAKLAELVELSVDQIKMIESNKSLGSLDSFVKICDALGVSPNQLLKDDCEQAQIAYIAELSSLTDGMDKNELKLLSHTLEALKDYISDK